ncbi:MAG: cell division protein FtsL [Candidatus Rokuibacteriota bacterium]|jgi:cell division protein FtsL
MSSRVATSRAPQSHWGSQHRARQHEAVRRHRVSDRRRLRSMAAAVLGAGLAVLIVLGVVGLRVQQVRLSYRLDALRQSRAELEETNRRLRVEMATLKSLSRIEGKARAELGMVAPGRDQVRLAREFVQSGGGSAALDRRAVVADRWVSRSVGVQ